MKVYQSADIDKQTFKPTKTFCFELDMEKTRDAEAIGSEPQLLKDIQTLQEIYNRYETNEKV